MNLMIALKNGTTINLSDDREQEADAEKMLMQKKMVATLQEMLSSMPKTSHVGGG